MLVFWSASHELAAALQGQGTLLMGPSDVATGRAGDDVASLYVDHTTGTWDKRRRIIVNAKPYTAGQQSPFLDDLP